MRLPRPFRYCFDPICVLSVLIYAANRWYLKPHHIGGFFTIGYLNDVICLPLFLPVILGVQRAVGVRRHDATRACGKCCRTGSFSPSCSR